MWREVDVAEGRCRRDSVTVDVRLEVFFELRLAGRFEQRNIFGQERELLHQAAADDDVVGVETELGGLANHDLFFDEVLDQAIELGTTRRSSHLCGPEVGELIDLRLADVDAAIVASTHERIERKQDDADDDEAEEGISDEVLHDALFSAFPGRQRRLTRCR